MSPATMPAYPQTYTAIDFAIQLSIIGGSGVIIIIVAWYLSRQRPSVTRASARNRHRREEDSYKKAEIILQDL
jgi:hypothetical protein